ncbi:MAG: TnpV protein [Ethanoligenens sp.]
MELTYRQEGDYLIPNLQVNEQPEGEIGRYGWMREKYLKEEHRGMYLLMAAKGTLWKHLLETDQEAQEMEDRLVAQMKKQRGVTEQLKADDQIRWVGEMNNIQASAREIVLHDLIYA